MSPQSFNTITPGNFELTPCRVTYGGVDLGATLGNVSIKIEESLAELKSDQLGTTPIDHKVSGFKTTVEFEFAEPKFKPNWKVLFPPNKLIGTAPTQSFYFDSQLGYSMRSGAMPLVLHPLSLPDSDKSQDFYFYLAASQAKTDYVFSPTEQVKLKCMMQIYPDFTTSPARFFVLGDPSIGIVPAVAGAATGGTGNVGNETISGISVFSGFTKTEVITAQCVTAGVTGKFFVSGSQSGALGLATVGQTFNSQEIAFTINDNTIHAAVGDSYQIATTAANYA